MKVYIRYQDDGPSGPCGQLTSTNPWDQLHVFPDYEQARMFMHQVENHTVGRKNPRITGVWQEEEIDHTDQIATFVKS
jgi:hypothetical protein